MQHAKTCLLCTITHMRKYIFIAHLPAIRLWHVYSFSHLMAYHTLVIQ